MKVQEAGHMLQAGQESIVQSTDLSKGDSCCSASSTDETYDPSASEAGNSDTSHSSLAMDLDSPAWLPVQHFPGFEETCFSTPEKRFFYEQNTHTRMGSGSFAVVTKVHWFNPSTGDLEPCIAKSLRVEMAATHCDGMLGLKADALHEKAALEHVAGVPGVVCFRDIIEERDGAVHIILEIVNGLRLSTRIAHRNSKRMGLTWLQIRLALKDLAQVLAECHKRGLVHGDVKPDNVMSLLAEDGITLIDFGSASLWNGHGWECEGGSLAYTAPETFLSVRWSDGDASPCFTTYGPQADCWSYGLTAFNLLTGSSFFEPAEHAVSPDEGSEGDVDLEDWRARCIINLQADWADATESHPIHATFQESLQQLAGASEEFQREGTNFLRRLLHPNPARRLTAEEALRHPFLTSPFVGVPRDSMPPRIVKEFVCDTTFKRQMWDRCDELLKKHMG